MTSQNLVSAHRSKGLPALPSGSVSTVTANQLPRLVDFYSLSEAELSALHTAGNYKTIDIGFFSLSFGSFLTLAITLATVEIADVRVNAIFWAMMVLSAVLSAVFGLKSWVAWGQADDLLKLIKRGPPDAGAAS